MIERTFGGYTYKYFVDSQATADQTANKAPDPGTLLVACPICGVDTKPRPAKFLPTGAPLCLMKRK